jgi:small glutamine-rich tetratricopeptide repeat-containing protein alpha
LHANCH